MGYVIVLLLAALAGGLVYWASMRYSGAAGTSEGDGASKRTEDGADDREARSAKGADPETPPTPAPGTAYIPVVPTRGSWQSRLGGVMGLVIAVVIAAATTAFVLYQAGHIITKLLTDAANSG